MRDAPAPAARWALHAAAFLSGTAALVYQIVWMRVLERTLGHGPMSVATVLATFMAGLALGGHVASRVLPRLRRPARAYCAVELGIALTAPLLLAASAPLSSFLTPLYDGQDPPGVAFAWARLAASAAVLLLPTTLMGMTLPLLVEAAGAETGSITRRAGALYAWNAGGAAAGALLAGFVVMPSLGIDRCAWLASATNVASALLVLAVARGPNAALVREGARARGRKGVLAVVAATGFAGMTLEVAWTRFIALQFGPSQASFAITVSAFIVGLAAGSRLLAPPADRCANPRAALGVMLLCSGAGALGVVVALPLLASQAATVVQGMSTSYAWSQVLTYAGVLGTLLCATVCLGGLMPFAVKACAGTADSPGSVVGRVCAWNAAGSILGPLAAALWILPRAGLRGTCVLGGIAYLVLAVPLLATATGRLRRYALATVPLAIGGALLLPPWSRDALLHAPYLHPHGTGSESGQIAFYRECATGVVAVTVTDEDRRVLRINGKADASNSPPDMLTQVLLAHLPALAADRPTGRPLQALVIGLGSGVTVGSLLSWGDVTVDCIEISPEVVEAARRHFGPENGAALADPRVRVLIEDGRTWLAHADREYDLIVSEPSSAWFAGMSDLFSVEFYEMCRRRLRPAGCMAQWIHAYALPVETYRSLVASFRDRFPAATLWETLPGLDTVLLSSLGGLTPESVREAWGRDLVRADLGRIGLRAPEQVYCQWVLDAPGLGRFVADVPPQRDAHPVAEFVAPRALHSFERASFLRALASSRGAFRTGVPAIDESRTAREELVSVQIDAGLDPAERLRRVDALLGRDPLAEIEMEGALLPYVGSLLVAGRLEDAVRIAELGVGRLPRSLPVRLIHAQALASQGRLAEAAKALQAAAERFPRAPLPREALAKVLEATPGVAEGRVASERDAARQMRERLRAGD